MVSFPTYIAGFGKQKDVAACIVGSEEKANNLTDNGLHGLFTVC